MEEVPAVLRHVSSVANAGSFGVMLRTTNRVRLTDQFLNAVRPILRGKRVFIVVSIGLERNMAVVLRDARDFLLHDTQGEFGMSLRRIAECFDATRVLPILISCARPPHMGVFVQPLPWAEDGRCCDCCGATVCSRVM